MRQARAVEHAQLQRAAPHVHVGALRMPCIGLGDLDAQCAENGAHVRQRCVVALRLALPEADDAGAHRVALQELAQGFHLPRRRLRRGRCRCRPARALPGLGLGLRPGRRRSVSRVQVGDQAARQVRGRAGSLGATLLLGLLRRIVDCLNAETVARVEYLAGSPRKIAAIVGRALHE